MAGDPSVTIVDYGAGNIRSVVNAFEYFGVDVLRSSDPDEVRRAERLVLPGVGAAGFAMDGLTRDGLDQALREAVLEGGKPMLGVCVGMQVLATTLTEYGERPGLGWTGGTVASLEGRGEAGEGTPHMGWSKVETTDRAPGWIRSALRAPVYFCHSFGLIDGREEHMAARCETHGGFVAALAFDTVVAMQFHPEKSQAVGRALIEGFCDWTP